MSELEIISNMVRRRAHHWESHPGSESGTDIGSSGVSVDINDDRKFEGAPLGESL